MVVSSPDERLYADIGLDVPDTVQGCIERWGEDFCLQRITGDTRVLSQNGRLRDKLKQCPDDIRETADTVADGRCKGYADVSIWFRDQLGIASENDGYVFVPGEKGSKQPRFNPITFTTIMAEDGMDKALEYAEGCFSKWEYEQFLVAFQKANS